MYVSEMCGRSIFQRGEDENRLRGRAKLKSAGRGKIARQKIFIDIFLVIMVWPLAFVKNESIVLQNGKERDENPQKISYFCSLPKVLWICFVFAIAIEISCSSFPKHLCWPQGSRIVVSCPTEKFLRRCIF